MHPPEPILLLTRPEAASRRFANMIWKAFGNQITICISPLLEIRSRTQRIDLQGAQGLIFTSSNAVDIVSALTESRDLPAFCVGSFTTQKARGAGWDALCVGRDANALVEDLISRAPKGPLVHMRGIHSRGDIARALTRSGLITSECVVYDQISVELSEEALALLSGENPVFVPLFSPRTAARFQCQRKGNAPLFPIALSQAVADEIQSECVVASRPDTEAMVLAVEKRIKQVCSLEAD